MTEKTSPPAVTEEVKSENSPPPPLHKFTDRVLTLTLPTAGVLAILVAAGELEPGTAIVSFGSVVMLTVVLMLPFLLSLQSLADYSKRLTEGEEMPPPELDFTGSDETAQIVRAINDMRNIWSSRTEALEAQTMSDAAVLDSLPDPLIMLDEKGVINGANLAARDIFGHSIRDKELSRIISDKKIVKAVEDVLSGASEREDVQFKMPEPWRKSFSARIEPLPWKSRGGAVAVISLHDLTALKRFEQMQADFVANASHELRTPLSIISGFIETLQGPAKEDETARNKFLNIMGDQARRMTQLVEDLLSLSRLELKEGGPVMEDVELDNLITEITGGLSLKADSKNMELKVDLTDIPQIKANKNEIRQIFQNLIDNAIKYGAEKTEVKVNWEVVGRIPPSVNYQPRDGMAVALTVRNFGNPIPEEHLPRLSERFYRVDSEQKTVGTGLGLAIVKQVIKRHHGSLKITSSEKEGTAFCVYLPLTVEDLEAKKKPENKD